MKDFYIFLFFFVFVVQLVGAQIIIEDDFIQAPRHPRQASDPVQDLVNNITITLRDYQANMTAVLATLPNTTAGLSLADQICFNNNLFDTLIAQANSIATDEDIALQNQTIPQLEQIQLAISQFPKAIIFINNEAQNAIANADDAPLLNYTCPVSTTTSTIPPTTTTTTPGPTSNSGSGSTTKKPHHHHHHHHLNCFEKLIEFFIYLTTLLWEQAARTLVIITGTDSNGST